MKKDLKALIKRLNLLVRFKQLSKGWMSIDGNGCVYIGSNRPIFEPSGIAESMDVWGYPVGFELLISQLDHIPLSRVCPSLHTSKAIFYTDGEAVWQVEV